MSTTKKVIISIVVLLVIALGIFFIFISGSGDGDVPDVETTLDDNAALVNGAAITQADFDSGLAASVASFASQGVDVENTDNLLQIKTQVLNDLINNELLAQGVAESGVSVSEEDVDTEVQAILDQAGSREAFEQQLADVSLTEEQLRENISLQLTTQAFVLQNVDVDSVTVSEEEVQKFYDDSKAVQPDLPPFDEVKDQAEQQLLTNKQQALINEFVESLRAGADIETAPLE